ncbi:MAG: secondary thiamine-phosphate synthase enzyme YjbQ [Halobacteriales archaeon]
MKSFSVETSARTEVVDVTPEVREAVVESDVVDGVCLVFVGHTTAGVVVNEAESRLLDDVVDYLGDVVPERERRHDELDGNADSHLRALLVGNDVCLPVEGGDVALGTWQSVLLVECDGPRSRDVHVEVVGV